MRHQGRRGMSIFDWGRLLRRVSCRLRSWRRSALRAGYRRARANFVESSDLELVLLAQRHALLGSAAARALDAERMRRSRRLPAGTAGNGAEAVPLEVQFAPRARLLTVARAAVVLVVWTLMLQLYLSGSAWFWGVFGICAAWAVGMLMWSGPLLSLRNRFLLRGRSHGHVGGER
jgi:hypothetical protein